MKNQIRGHANELLRFDQRFESRARDSIQRRWLKTGLLELLLNFLKSRAFLIAEAGAMLPEGNCFALQANCGKVFEHGI